VYLRVQSGRSAERDAVERIIQFHGGPRAVGAARDAVLEHASSLPRETLEDLQLLVSEVVTNAVRHGGGSEGDPVTLRLVEEPGTLRIEVSDDGPGFERRTPTPRSDGGWGLFFVDRLASKWDVETSPARTMVWFEMDVPVDGGGSKKRSRLAMSA